MAMTVGHGEGLTTHFWERANCVPHAQLVIGRLQDGGSGLGGRVGALMTRFDMLDVIP